MIYSSLVLKYGTAFASLLISSFVIVKTVRIPGNELLFLFPLLYGLFMFIFPAMSKHMKGNIGLTVFNYILFVRYSLAPLIRALAIDDNFNSQYQASVQGLEIGIWIMIFELLFSFVVVQIFAKHLYIEKSTQTVNYNPIKSKLVIILITLIGFAFILIFPTVIDRYNFFVITSDVEQLSQMTNINSIVLIIVDLLLVIIPVLMLNYFKTKHLKNPSFRYLLYSLISIIPFMLIFKGSSRISIVVPTIAWLVILLKLYPMYKKFIATSVLSIVVIVFTSITLYKQFDYTLQDKSIAEPITYPLLSLNLNAYFSGPDNMGLAVDLKDSYGEYINLTTLKNDLTYNVAGLSQFADKSNTSTGWFNTYIYGRWASVDQIIPLSGQGFLYFGFIGSTLFLIVTLILMMFFDNKIRQENRIEFVYIYVYLVVHMAMAMMISLGSIYSLFINLMLPVLIIFKLNRWIILK